MSTTLIESRPDATASRQDLRLMVRTMADVEAFEQTPLSERNLPDSTYAMLRETSRRRPDAPALFHFESGDELDRATSVTHAELFERITQTANLLHSLGIGPTDVVGVVMPIVPESQYAIWGAEAAGIVCPISWMLEPEIIAALLRRAGAKAVIAYGPDDDIEAWHKVMQIRKDLPEVRHWIKAGGAPLRDDSIVDLLAKLPDFNGDSLDSGRIIASSDIASMFHTGGTTGTPKLALHTHANEVFMAWISALQYDVRPTDVRVCGVPMFHVTGVLTSCFMPIVAGASVVMLSSSGWRDPSVIRNMWRIIERFRITTLSMVPTVVNLLLNIPLEGADIRSLKTATCGTAPLSAAVADAFTQKTGAMLIEGYGLTEGTALSATNPRHGEARVGSIGFRFAYEQMRAVKVTNGRIERDCAPGEPGIVVVRGPNVFPGYFGAAHNQDIWLDDNWFNTGDLGYADEEGYFWLTGRAKDLIIRGGNNIDPRMIEEALYRHPEVFDAAAVGIPDAHAGELPVVYVALKVGSTYPIGRLKHYAYEAIPERAAVPKQFYVVDSIPKTSVGKIQKNSLRSDAIRRVQWQLLADAQGPTRVPVVDIRVDDRGDRGVFSTLVLPAALSDEEKDVALATIRSTFATMVVKYEVRYE
jgi:fatty-acyl-CoA synthase